MWSWPLTLELLDLSSNNVTEVPRLPTTWKAVSFRDNPQISFGKDVVKKATEHFVSLDLRNATFAHPSDTSSSKSLRAVFFKVGSSRPIDHYWVSAMLAWIMSHCFSLQLKRVRARPPGIRCMSYVLSPLSNIAQGSHRSVREQRDKAESCENSYQSAAWLRMLLGKTVSPQVKICRKTVTSFMHFRVRSFSFILWNLKLEGHHEQGRNVIQTRSPNNVLTCCLSTFLHWQKKCHFEAECIR